MYSSRPAAKEVSLPYILNNTSAFMDILKFGHHTTDQANPTQTPPGVIRISDKEARDRSTIPYIDPNPVPFTTLILSTPD
jgi:hypothetical protein